MPMKTKVLPPKIESLKSRTTKRAAVETNAGTKIGGSKKIKLEETILRAKQLLEEIRRKAQEEEAEEDAEESEEDDEVPGLSDDVQGRLDYIDVMVQHLTKDYLRKIMKALKIYGSGTNKTMVATIMTSIRQEADGGADLEREERVIRRVHRECYGPGEDSDPDEDLAD